MKNRTAIITGATGALGKTVTELFRKDSQVIAIARDKAKLSLLEKPGSSSPIKTIAADITRVDQVKMAISEIIQEFGSIDIFVHLAGGFSGGKSIADTDIDTWDSMMNLNLKSAFLFAKYVLPEMQKQKHGKIITISAMAAMQQKPNRAAYAISKSGLLTLTKALAIEYKDDNIQVNSITPGIIKTESNIDAMPDANHSDWIPTQKIAQTIHYLCSEIGDSITGTVIEMP